MTQTAVRPPVTETPAPAFDVPGFIRRLRRALDLSQIELAERIGVSQSTIARWETGACEPSISVFAQMMAMADWVLTVQDVDETEPVPPMRPDGVRDAAGRRRPAHLDVTFEPPLPFCHGRKVTDRRAWGRDARDWSRRHTGMVPDDHPTEAHIREHLAEWQRGNEERNRQFAERLKAAMIARGEPDPDTWECECLVGCFEVAGCLVSCDCKCEPALFEPGGTEPVAWTDVAAELSFLLN
ncbi:helix-turn-helix domain-containing protein [Granulicoccus sp. GXG6511]|uniref:helix-turn-helix domain-containing protein n=1 Tax=Granulicoccus sp. GXG6511 TaxID=3381351 RepID=UPI003D7F144B